MRANDLLNIKADMNSLDLTIPADIQKYESILEKLTALPNHEGKRNLDGVNTPKDVAAEVERRALDAVLAKERANQQRIMTDAAHRNIDRVLINATETIIDDLRPIVMKAHETIMDAHATMNGSLTAEAAIELDAAQEFKAANEAWKVIDTAATIRSRLYSLDRPDFDRSVERRLTFFRFHTLTAWRTYETLPNLGSGAANHAVSASTDGVIFAWLSTDDAEEQSRALGKAQTAEKNGDQSGMVFDAENMVYRVGDDGWKYL